MNNDKFDYFIERTEKDLAEIKTKLDKLWGFKMMLLGGSAAVSVLVTILFNALALYLGRH